MQHVKSIRVYSCKAKIHRCFLDCFVQSFATIEILNILIEAWMSQDIQTTDLSYICVFCWGSPFNFYCTHCWQIGMKCNVWISSISWHTFEQTWILNFDLFHYVPWYEKVQAINCDHLALFLHGNNEPIVLVVYGGTVIWGLANKQMLSCGISISQSRMWRKGCENLYC